MSISSPSGIPENDIQAFVDNRLTAEQSEAVKHYLEANPHEARRVRQLQELNRLVAQQSVNVIDEPIPARLLDSVAKDRPLKPTPRPLRRVASLAWVLFGGALGWGLHSQFDPTMNFEHQFPRQAAFAHVAFSPEVLHPVEVTADQEEHLVKWLSKRMKTELKVPHLGEFGFHLVGGRLLPGDSLPTAQFMYENEAGTRLTLYVKNHETENSESTFRFARENEVSVFFWIDGSLGYALSGDVDKNKLLDVSTAVYQQLTL